MFDASPSTSPAVAAVVGASFELTAFQHFGFRLMGLGRWYIAQEPNYGNLDANGQEQALGMTLYTAPVVQFDVMVRL